MSKVLGRFNGQDLIEGEGHHVFVAHFGGRKQCIRCHQFKENAAAKCPRAEWSGGFVPEEMLDGNPNYRLDQLPAALAPFVQWYWRLANCEACREKRRELKEMFLKHFRGEANQ